MCLLFLLLVSVSESVWLGAKADDAGGTPPLQDGCYMTDPPKVPTPCGNYTNRNVVMSDCSGPCNATRAGSIPLCNSLDGSGTNFNCACQYFTTDKAACQAAGALPSSSSLPPARLPAAASAAAPIIINMMLLLLIVT
ncbi:hypothetical protein DM860_014681 [Cuscuta australis]|uniref:Uncharacterized protein n=1 Tax=Cuscuta australis TaxID=267555 RepID=A0A328DM43_9ASTE|nr:hypothetical protein DM860_014681 [Cuscuta australis]